MDGQRFDQLARGMAQKVRRRGLLRGFAAGAAVLMFGGIGLRQGRAQSDCGDECRRNEVCVDGACVPACREDRDCRDRSDDACIGGRCDDGVCTSFIVDCAPGYVCCGNGRCCPITCQTDIDCFTAQPCVIARCGDEGVCQYTDRDPCVTCSSDAECAGAATGAICCSGTCVSPCPAGFTLSSKGCECHATNTTGSAEGTIVVANDRGQSGRRSEPEVSELTTTDTEPATVSEGAPADEASPP